MLPDINGNVVCKTIRQNPAFAHMKIIFVSGVVDRGEIEDLLRAGADDFVSKPFNVSLIVEKIAGMLKLDKPTGISGQWSVASGQ
jgi:DNA-binding response OmpR family regulator